ncbi:MAG: DUF2218 domain-containing protein [Rubrobacteraceae bacterium]
MEPAGKGIVEFPELGVCRMEARSDELVLAVEAPDGEKLARVEGIVGDHLEQFGKRDGLTVQWTKEGELGSRWLWMDPERRRAP